MRRYSYRSFWLCVRMAGMWNKKKTIKLTNELMGYCFNAGIRKLCVDIDNQVDRVIITIQGRTPKDIEDEIHELRILLNSQKEPQMEEYYWELMGETDHTQELSLVGMIIDRAEIYYRDRMLEMRIHKKY